MPFHCFHPCHRICCFIGLGFLQIEEPPSPPRVFENTSTPLLTLNQICDKISTFVPFSKDMREGDSSKLGSHNHAVFQKGACGVVLPVVVLHQLNHRLGIQFNDNPVKSLFKTESLSVLH